MRAIADSATADRIGEITRRLHGIPKAEFEALPEPASFCQLQDKLEELLCSLRGLAMVPRDRFLAEHLSQVQAERWIQVAGQCALDMAIHFIGSNGWAAPANYEDAFLRLAGEGILESELARRMGHWVELRDLLIDLDAVIDHGLLHQTLTDELDQLEAYARALTSLEEAL